MAIRHPGFRFRPTDEQLFVHYLLRRLNHEPLPDPNAVHDCDVYGGGDPWTIFGKDRDEKFYVFTVLKRKNKSQVDRTAGSGTWKGEQSHEIRDSRGELVGYKKLFTFKPKAGSSAEADKAENGHWIMYEYSTHPHDETECVLCVISNKYAEKVNKKAACWNLHGRVQLEEENRRAKKAHPFRSDHINAVNNPSTSSPPSTTATATATATAQAHPATSLPFNEDTVVNLPPTTSMAAQGVDYDQWAHQLMNMEIDPSVHDLFYTVLKQRARVLHERNDLVESHPEGVPANWPDEFLDFSQCTS